MQILVGLVVLGLSYLIGSIPFGLLVVRLFTGKDVRKIGSGRTGGTNVMRAAGVVAGALTGLMDVMKGVASGWLVTLLLPEASFLRVLAAAMAILGAIHSVFLAERDPNGRLHLRGGAGGATTLGGAIALWPESVLIILPFCALVYIFIGYASVTTISAAASATLIFAARAIFWGQTWVYVLYGLLALGLVLYALQPNLKRLREGTERKVGLRAYFHKRAASQSAKTRPAHPTRRKQVKDAQTAL